METTSRVGTRTAQQTTQPEVAQPEVVQAEAARPDGGGTAVKTAPGEGGASVAATRLRTLDGYRRADFAWYGLDEAFTGPRWLLRVATGADGAVEHGAIGHGDEPCVRSGEQPQAEKERFAVVITVASSPLRRSGDGTGVLEATSVSSAAWLAGSGLLAATWPGQMDHALREHWLDQQTEAAWLLADELTGPEWTTLTLPVDEVPTLFHYRESEFGWVLAGTAESGAHLGAYGRGMSAYGLAFSAVGDIAAYA
ncbi:hypothetical protein [Streptomyces sp. NPDC006879]|uniref:hypothetical protein n=1 Tax=Streptomyces sp. NPDC006879 TaxID=3364767 RepID=UPI00368C608A